MLKIVGFSLIEMLIVISLSSIVLLSASKILPGIQWNVLQIYQRHRLMQVLKQTLIPLENDLRRAGFIATKIGNNPLNSVRIEPESSCVMIIYDSRLSGQFNLSTGVNSDIYAYRVINNALEHQRGVTNCQSRGWEKLNDPAEIKIISFQLIEKQYFFVITVIAQWKNNKNIMISYPMVIRKMNR